MVGKALVYQTKVDKIISMDRNLKDLYALDRTRTSVKQTAIAPGGSIPSAGGSSGGIGNFLETQGDTMIGPIAFNQVFVGIVDGRIKIGENDRFTVNGPPTYSSYVSVTGQGSPDDLNWIDGAAYNGQLLFLQGTPSQLITITNAIRPPISNISGTGTVTVVTSVDHKLVTGQEINIFSTTNFNVSEVTITVTNATTFTYADAGDATPETSGIVQDGNIFSNDETNVILDGVGKTYLRAGVTLIFDQLNPNGGGWSVFARPDVGGGGITASDNVTWTGIHSFNGSSFSVNSPVIVIGDEATDSITVAGRIASDFLPIADLAHDLGKGSLRWENIHGGTIIGTSMSATGSFSSLGATILGDNIADTISIFGTIDTNVNLGGNTILMGTGGNITGIEAISFEAGGVGNLNMTGSNIVNPNRIDMQNSSSVLDINNALITNVDTISMNGDGATILFLDDLTMFDSGSTITMTGGGLIRQIGTLDFNASGTNDAFIIANAAGFNYNVTDPDKHSFGVDSSLKIEIGNDFLISLVPFDMNQNYIRFDGMAVPTQVGGEPLLFADSTNSDHLSIQPSSGPVIDLEAGGSGGANLQLSNLVATVDVNQTINLQNNVDIIPNDLFSSLGDGTHSFTNTYTNSLFLNVITKSIVSSGSLDVVHKVPSGGDIKFLEDITEFWRLDGGANVSVFSRDIELDGTNRAIRAFDSTEIGFFVRDGGETVGQQGTIQIPTTTAGGIGTNSQLNTAFGNAIGAIGIYNVNGSLPVLSIKIATGEWIVIALPDSSGNVTSDHVF